MAGFLTRLIRCAAVSKRRTNCGSATIPGPSLRGAASRVDHSQRALSPHRWLVGAVHLAELARPDEGAQLEAGHGSLGTTWQQWRGPVARQRGGVGAETN